MTVSTTIVEAFKDRIVGSGFSHEENKRFQETRARDRRHSSDDCD